MKPCFQNLTYFSNPKLCLETTQKPPKNVKLTTKNHKKNTGSSRSSGRFRSGIGSIYQLQHSTMQEVYQTMVKKQEWLMVACFGDWFLWAIWYFISHIMWILYDCSVLTSFFRSFFQYICSVYSIYISNYLSIHLYKLKI